MSCSSSGSEPTLVNSTAVTTTKPVYVMPVYPRPTFAQVTITARKITYYVTGPLAVVTNGLSLIVFTRLYRAKQQVINIARCVVRFHSG